MAKCFYGYNQQAAHRLFWKYRTPAYLEAIDKKFAIADKDFVAAMTVCVNPAAEEIRDQALTKIASGLEMDADTFIAEMTELAKPEAKLSRYFNSFKKTIDGAKAQVEFLIYKPKESFEQEIKFVWHEGAGYLP
jgi:hypothetical protein